MAHPPAHRWQQSGQVGWRKRAIPHPMPSHNTELTLISPSTQLAQSLTLRRSRELLTTLTLESAMHAELSSGGSTPKAARGTSRRL